MSTLEDYIKNSQFLIGIEYTEYFISHISDILQSKKFYSTNCRVPFYFKKCKDINGNISIAKDCPLTLAINSLKGQSVESYWATFHPDWRTQSGKFVIRKGYKEICITRDFNQVRAYLDIPL